MSSDHDTAPPRSLPGNVLKRGRIALIVLPFILFLVWRGSVAMDIKRLREKSIDRGEPQTMAEIVERFPEIKPDENAAEGIVDIWQHEEGDYWKEWRTSGKVQSESRPNPIDPNVPFVGQTTQTALPWAEPELTAARAFVESRQAHSKRIKDALARPYARYPINYPDGFLTLLPHLAKVKFEVTALQVQNVLAIQEARVAESIESMDQMAALAGTLKEEPFLISQLVRIACTAVTLRGVEQLVDWQPLNVSQLDQLTEIVDRLDLGDGFQRSMLAERAGGLSVFGIPFEQLNDQGFDSLATGKGLVGGVVSSLMKFSGFLSVDQRLMLDAYDQVLVLSTNLTPANQDKITQTMDDTATKARTFPPKLFTGMLLPALSKASVKFMNMEAERRLWRAALAVESYRVKHEGRLPEELSDVHLPVLGGDILDPFDGRTIMLQVQPNGYQLRSIDTDRLPGAAAPPAGPNDFSVSVVHRYSASGAQ